MTSRYPDTPFQFSPIPSDTKIDLKSVAGLHLNDTAKFRTDDCGSLLGENIIISCI